MKTQKIVTTLCAALIVFIAGPAIWQTANACTRVLWNNNDLAVIVGRTMDWPETTEPIITVFPRGMERDGGRLGTEEAVKNNPAKWASKYASMVITAYGLGTADGFNERGLAAHLQYFDPADFGPRDPSKPGVQAVLWAQYALDNAATVDQALALLKKIQPVMVEARGHKAKMHLVVWRMPAAIPPFSSTPTASCTSGMAGNTGS